MQARGTRKGGATNFRADGRLSDQRLGNKCAKYGIGISRRCTYLAAIYGLCALCGRHGLNIATFHLGRRNVGGEAVRLVEVDGALPAGRLDEIKSLPQVVRADSLPFSAQD